MGAINDFKAFILRGSVVDLAVGVVVGAAFTSVVNGFVKDVLTPLVTIPGKVNFSDVHFKLGGGDFLIGDFINNIISFLLIATVVFFLVVRPVNWLMARRKAETPADPTTYECPFCLSKIPLKAKRCAFCTAEVEPKVEVEGD